MAAMSPDNTIVTLKADGSIMDASGAIWSLDAKDQVTINGNVDASLSGVSVIALENGKVWAETNDGHWQTKASANGTWSAPTTVSPIPATTGTTSGTGTPPVDTTPHVPPLLPIPPASSFTPAGPPAPPKPQVPTTTPFTADETAILKFEAAFNPDAAKVSTVLYDGVHIGADIQALGTVVANGGDQTAPTLRAIGDLQKFLQDYVKAGAAISGGTSILGGVKIALPPDFAVAVVKNSITAIQAGNSVLDDGYGKAVSGFFNSEQAAMVTPVIPHP